MITVIGDVHGKYSEYYNKIKNSEYSVQLGDFGFSKEWVRLLNHKPVSPSCHRIICGNHDDYDLATNISHNLGNFGYTSLGEIKFFYVRGGLSIDRVYRVGEELSGGPKTYWSQEELNFTEMVECLALYTKVKPDIVMSHVPPGEFTPYIFGNKESGILQRFKFHEGFRENTQLLGNEMLKVHRPKIWCSGHLHASFQGDVNGTRVISLNELETFNLTMDTVHQLSAKGSSGKDFLPPRQLVSMENIKDGLGL